MSSNRNTPFSRKPKILCLVSHADGGYLGEIQQWISSGSFEWEAVSLPKLSDWQPSTRGTDILFVLVDLDAVAQTQELSDWSYSAWRSTFNDLIVRTVTPEGRPPMLIGYTREPSWDRAVLAVRIGARDLVKLSKLADRLEELIPSLAFHVEKVEPHENLIRPSFARETTRVVEREVLKSIPKHAIPFPIEGLEGTSKPIETVRNWIRRCAPLETPVVVQGATGVGKERVARALHSHSPRKPGPFVVVNCGAIPSELFEAEFFGYLKGAYTGALADRIGYIQQAQGGTLFLDEVGSLSLDFQAKLLRVLQDGIVVPLGSSSPFKVDFRLVCSSSVDLSELVERGRFREDLMYRIKVMDIALPSLQERREDIPELAASIVRKCARKYKRSAPELSSGALEKLLMYTWPGNVRELENVLERSLAMVWGENRNSIDVDDLSDVVQFAVLGEGQQAGHLKDIVARFEKEYIAATIRRLGGDKEHAAEVLGLSLATLYRKIG